MSQSKLAIGLPIALLLGVSAIAIGVVPGVRDWIDQTIPWMGINGPVTSLPDKPDDKLAEVEPVLPAGVPVASQDNSLLERGPSLAQPEVTFAQAIAPLPPKLPQGRNEEPVANPGTRLAQLPSFNTVPATGINVPSSGNGTVFVQSATVSFEAKEITVAAQADGIIMSLLVDDGSMIKAGEPMIAIDQRLAEKEVAVSQEELSSATLKASDDSNLKYSKAALAVAAADVEISKDLQAKGAEGVMDGEKKKLEFKKAGFQVDVANITKKVDAADVGVKTAKLEAAKVQLELRNIKAQRTGMISEMLKRQFDWVRAGEPICKLTPLEEIRIKGNAIVRDNPGLLLNAPARVTIQYGEGKFETVEGAVGFVSPKGHLNSYPIHVNVPNRLMPDGQYLFREGMQATIEITPRSR